MDKLLKKRYDKARYARIKAKKLAQMRAWSARNREKKNATQRKYYKRNKAACRAAARAYYKKNRLKWYHYNQRSKYPTPTRPMPMRCECCGLLRGKKRLHNDHDHKQKKFRGWLCSNCNTGIGLLGDSLAGLAKATNYLKEANVKRT
jgi:hypothetical protein